MIDSLVKGLDKEMQIAEVKGRGVIAMIDFLVKDLGKESQIPQNRRRSSGGTKKGTKNHGRCRKMPPVLRRRNKKKKKEKEEDSEHNDNTDESQEGESPQHLPLLLDSSSGDGDWDDGVCMRACLCWSSSNAILISVCSDMNNPCVLPYLEFGVHGHSLQ